MMRALGQTGYTGDYLIWWVLFASLVAHTWCFFRFFPRDRQRRRRLILGNALVFACLLGVVGLVGETYYRFLCVRIDAFGVSLPAQRWFGLYTSLNSLGCRDKEWMRTAPVGVRRIAFVGDSFTYGWGIEDTDRRFPDLIQAKLETQRPGTFEVLNVAKPGWGTDRQLQPVKDMIDIYGVKEIVLCHVPNDIEKLLPASPSFDPTVPPEPSWFNPDSSYLLYELYQRAILPRKPTVRGYHDWLADGYANKTLSALHKQQIDDIARVCHERGATLRVVLLPFIKTQGDRFDQAAIHAQLASFLRARGIPVLDLLPVLSRVQGESLMVNARDPHPNEAAHRLFAEAIWAGFYADGPSNRPSEKP